MTKLRKEVLWVGVAGVGGDADFDLFFGDGGDGDFYGPGSKS